MHTIPIIHHTLGAVCFEFARATGLNKPLPKAGLFGKGEAVITFMLTDEQEDMLVFHGGERCSTDEGDENLMPVWTHYALYSLCTVLTMHCTHYALYSLCAVLTMHCTHYALYSLCTVLTMHCTHYALFSLCTVLTMHCTHYALYSLCTVLTRYGHGSWIT
jgi:hypothetical protein